MDHMDTGSATKGGRRGFLLAATTLLVAPAVWSQRAERIARIGFVVPTASGSRNEAFLQGLRALGYVEGKNLSVETRFAQGQVERLPALVEELIQLKVDVLVVGSTLGARAAMRATTTIPIVFAGSSDPVAGGVVTNLARPGGNITGFSLAYGDGFAGKWLELLKEASNVPHVSVIWNSANAAAAKYLKEVETAAGILRVRLDAHQASKNSELEVAFAAIAGGGTRGLIVMPSPFFAANVDKLVQFAASRQLPAIYFDDGFVHAGGLMSYGPSVADSYRRAAAHVDRILKGAKPGELPVEQPTKFELVVNLTTASALGLKIPQTLLLRADRLIP